MSIQKTKSLEISFLKVNRNIHQNRNIKITFYNTNNFIHLKFEILFLVIICYLLIEVWNFANREHKTKIKD